MKKGRPVLFAIVLVVLFLVGIFAYRNFYLKELTASNLGELVSSVKDGKIRDYHNTIGVQSKDDIHYVYDSLMSVYKIYYGNYTIYLASEDTAGWSAQALEEYLNKIGISFESKDNKLIFYYFGEELSTIVE